MAIKPSHTHMRKLYPPLSKFLTTKQYIRYKLPILEICKYKCCICDRISVHHIIHHIVPRIIGGTNNHTNLIAVCPSLHHLEVEVATREYLKNLNIVETNPLLVLILRKVDISEQLELIENIKRDVIFKLKVKYAIQIGIYIWKMFRD